MNEYYEYFGPDYELDVKPSNMEDMNSPGYLDRVKGIVLDHLRHVGGPPSVQMQGQHGTHVLMYCCSQSAVSDVPRIPIDDVMDDIDEGEDTVSKDERRPQRLLDSRRQADGELSDSDDEGEGGRRNHASHAERDSVTAGASRRAAVGIMTTGTTHGLGPSASTAVANAPVLNTTTGSSGQSDMDIDDDSSVGQTSGPVRARSKSKPPLPPANGMAVDSPVTSAATIGTGS